MRAHLLRYLVAILGVTAVYAQEVGRRGFADAARARAAGQWEGALQILKDLEARADTASKLARVATELELLSSAAEDSAALEHALRARESALLLRQRIHGDRDDIELATSLRAAGRVLQRLKRPQEALEHHERALAMLHRLGAQGHEAQLAQCLNHVAFSLLETGQPDAALKRVQELLPISRSLHSGDDHPDVVDALLLAARCLESLNRPSEAVSKGEEAVAIADRLGGATDRVWRLRSCVQLASSLAAAGRPWDAVTRYRAAFELLGPDHRGLDDPEFASVLNNYAGCLAAAGKYGEALGSYRESLSIRRRVLGTAQDRGIATVLNNIGCCLMQTGQLAEALRAFEESSAIRERYTADRSCEADRANSLYNAAACLTMMGRHREALPMAEKALAMRRQLFAGRDHTDVAISLIGLGVCLQGLDRVADAQPFAEEALAMFARIYGSLDHHDLVLAHKCIANCLSSQDDYAAAMPHFEAAAAMSERLLGASRAASGELRTAFFDDLKKFGLYQSMQLGYVKAKDARSAFLCAERTRCRDLLDRTQERGGDPLQQACQRALQRGDRTASDKIANLSERLTAARHEGDQILHELTRLTDSDVDWDHVQARRAELEQRSRRFNSDLNRLLDERARWLAESFPPGVVRDAGAVARALEKGEMLLEYSVGENGTLLYLIRPEGEVGCIGIGIKEDALTRLVLRWIATISEPRQQSRDLAPSESATASRPLRSAELAAGRELFALLLPPEVRGEVVACRRVWIAPHRALHRLPFESLIHGELDGKPRYWLDDGPPIAYVPSGSTLCWLRERARTDKPPPRLQVLAIGDPAAEMPPGSRPAEASVAAGAKRDASNLERVSRLPALAGARREAESIGELFARGTPLAAKVLLGSAAVERVVRELAGDAKYLHFACHGIAEEAVGRSLSMLVLSRPATIAPDDDGFLTLDDLSLGWGGRLDACRLVTLSACRTYVGPQQLDDAPAALPTGFLLAGASAVLASLWAVDDRSTAELMVDFYGRLIGGERDQLVALTAARKALRAKYPDPLHWAAFLYIGQP